MLNRSFTAKNIKTPKPKLEVKNPSAIPKDIPRMVEFFLDCAHNSLQASTSSLEGEVSACEPCLMYVWPSMVMVSLLMNSLLDLVNFRRFECVNQIQERSLSKGRSSRSQRYKVGSGWALGCLV